MKKVTHFWIVALRHLTSNIPSQCQRASAGLNVTSCAWRWVRDSLWNVCAIYITGFHAYFEKKRPDSQKEEDDEKDEDEDEDKEKEGKRKERKEMKRKGVWHNLKECNFRK